VSPEHPVARRILALSEPGLFLLRRGPNDKGDRLAQDIRVAQVRKMANFFALSSADGGRRVVIVDAADELNTQAANALLKMLEEPPARTVMLLVAHQPSGLLPTIRSRCRMLRLLPLGPGDMRLALDQAGIAPGADPAVLAELSAGSVGAAVRRPWRSAGPRRGETFCSRSSTCSSRGWRGPGPSARRPPSGPRRARRH
jgi:DNA polymerase-3 subunit delta'